MNGPTLTPATAPTAATAAHNTRPATNSSPDPCACPLCGQPNQCANEIERTEGIPQEPCWCTTAVFGPDLLARVPASAVDRACICARCAAAPTI